MTVNNFHPQTFAARCSKIHTLDIQSENACCAYVFLWCLNIPLDNLTYLELTDEAIKKGYIEKDCTVWWSKWGEALTGRKVEVEFEENLKSIKNIKKRTPVFYSIDGKSGHWVGVEKGKIVFNPENKSVNVEKGKPRKARYISVL